MLMKMRRNRIARTSLVGMPKGTDNLQSSLAPTIQPATALLGIYLKELKIGVHTETCTGMFIAALFIIVRRWNSFGCPSTGEWLNRSIQSEQHYSME